MIDYRLQLSQSSESIPYTPAITSRNLPFYLNVWGHFEAGSGYFTKREGQEDFLIIHTLNGSGFLEYRNAHFTLYKGDIFFIDCREAQYYGTGSEGYWDIEWIHFAGSGCKAYFDLINGNSLNIIHIDDTSEILDCMNEIRRLIEGKDFQADIKISLLITRILTCLAINRQRPAANQGQRYSSIVNNAIDYIHTYYAEPLSISNIASAVHLSPFHFVRVFKDYTSMGPHEYLIKYRIDKSKRLLRDTAMSVSEIASLIGFDNVNNFIRNFKRLVGTTPLKYRRFWIE